MGYQSVYKAPKVSKLQTFMTQVDNARQAGQQIGQAQQGVEEQTTNARNDAAGTVEDTSRKLGQDSQFQMKVAGTNQPAQSKFTTQVNTGNAWNANVNPYAWKSTADINPGDIDNGLKAATGVINDAGLANTTTYAGNQTAIGNSKTARTDALNQYMDGVGKTLGGYDKLATSGTFGRVGKLNSGELESADFNNALKQRNISNAALLGQVFGSDYDTAANGALDSNIYADDFAAMRKRAKEIQDADAAAKQRGQTALKTFLSGTQAAHDRADEFQKGKTREIEDLFKSENAANDTEFQKSNAALDKLKADAATHAQQLKAQAGSQYFQKAKNDIDGLRDYKDIEQLVRISSGYGPTLRAKTLAEAADKANAKIAQINGMLDDAKKKFGEQSYEYQHLAAYSHGLMHDYQMLVQGQQPNAVNKKPAVEQDAYVGSTPTIPVPPPQRGGAMPSATTGGSGGYAGQGGSSMTGSMGYFDPRTQYVPPQAPAPSKPAPTSKKKRIVEEDAH